MDRRLYDFLKYECENQTSLTKKDFVQKFDYNLRDAEHYFNLLNPQDNALQTNLNVLEFLSEKLLKAVENPNLFEFYNELNNLNLLDLLTKKFKRTIALKTLSNGSLQLARDCGNYLLRDGFIGIFPKCPHHFTDKTYQFNNPFLDEELFHLVKKKKNLIIFFAHSAKDSQAFKISELEKALLNYEEIDRILIYEKEKYGDFVLFMNESIKACDMVIVFCSDHIRYPSFTYDEWSAAFASRKQIIPVFIKLNYVPILLRKKSGCLFAPSDFKKTIECIYQSILKRLA